MLLQGDPSLGHLYAVKLTLELFVATAPRPRTVRLMAQKRCQEVRGEEGETKEVTLATAFSEKSMLRQKQVRPPTRQALRSCSSRRTIDSKALTVVENAIPS